MSRLPTRHAPLAPTTWPCVNTDPHLRPTDPTCVGECVGGDGGPSEGAAVPGVWAGPGGREEGQGEGNGVSAAFRNV